jgi:uncharacterized protein (TIGR02118 family)
VLSILATRASTDGSHTPTGCGQHDARPPGLRWRELPRWLCALAGLRCPCEQRACVHLKGQKNIARLFAIHEQPEDAAAFDRYCFAHHVPLATSMPGLRSYEVTRGDVMGMGGKHNVYLGAVLEFDSMTAIGAALASPQRQANAADVARFASGGVDAMFAEAAAV